MDWLDHVKWNASGLVPVVTQECATQDVLTLAWMNREALQQTVQTGEATYFSRSRNRLWRKGEESGHIQKVQEIRLDCDHDAVLIKVIQLGHSPGIACHTGRHSCFFEVLYQGQWVVREPVLKDPANIYPGREQREHG